MRCFVSPAVHVRRVVDGDAQDGNAVDEGGAHMATFVFPAATTASLCEQSSKQIKSARPSRALPSLADRNAP